MADERRPAAFLDRDGTLIVEREYLADAAGVELIPGAAAGLRALRDAGFALVVVTNQSGIGRGYYGMEAFQAVQRRVEELLAGDDVAFDGVYVCPHYPEVDGPCACRKPATGLYLQAARDLGLDVARSLFVGDKRADLEPAAALGGRAILVRTGYGRQTEAGLGGAAALAVAGIAAIDSVAHIGDVVSA